jgi:MEMO1 family protein
VTELPRPPAVAGAFYAATGAELARQLERCFLDPRGPGELPVRHRSTSRSLRAAVVPHAGYDFSGAIAAHVYALVAAQRPPDAVLVLGVDHHGLGLGPTLSDRAWVTPLGPMDVDHDLVRALAAGPVEIDEGAQAEEHSIEVQLPFLEYVLPRPAFVALQLRFDGVEALVEIGRIVANAIRGRDVLLLASTDFSHYVPARVSERLDHLAIEAILRRDARELYRTVERNDISMCGIAPTTVLLAALEGEALNARLLRWGHSGEAQPMREVVGYAALALETTTGAPPPVK